MMRARRRRRHGRHGPHTVCRWVQRGLEGLYRLPRGPDVGEFIVPEREPDGASERLLVAQNDDDGVLRLALCLDQEALKNLGEHPPSRRLDERNLADFCLVAEGVSHFVYLVCKAARGEPVTQLELELQAEVDKYVTCMLALMKQDNGRFPDTLRERLFLRFTWRNDLPANEADRYRTANRLAADYCAFLEDNSRRGGVGTILPEIRRFYRLTHRSKIERITLAA